MGYVSLPEGMLPVFFRPSNPICKNEPTNHTGFDVFSFSSRVGWGEVPRRMLTSKGWVGSPSIFEGGHVDMVDIVGWKLVGSPQEEALMSLDF